MMRKIVKMVKIVSKLQMVFNMLKWCSLFTVTAVNDHFIRGSACLGVTPESSIK